MDESILWATTVVDRRAELDKREQKRRARARKLGILIVHSPGDTTEKSSESLNQSIANVQAEEQARKVLSELRREIVDLGGAENITQLRLRKKIKNKAVDPSGLADVPAGPVDREDFLMAATKGKLKIVEKFLEDGGDPDTCDEFRKSALHRAAFEGHVMVVERLLDKGADINLQDRLDCTAMHWACRGGRLGVLKVLQSRGAKLNIRDKLMSTPLHVATRTGHWEVVEHLLASGIKINAQDREGDTALHDAVRLNRYKIVKLLILAGADMKIKNAEGITATEQVKMWQFDTKETLEKLEQMNEGGLA
ncbi:ankyrin repeat domain-containing protein 2 [Colossoma macropomum]|uniref:ankyrin repeat domain-containing protein 2 n=1 Tax=Colossoma macropomum TaxID=42526 RepID=UPI0018646A43|nr:ankyrin repeat domain-containing protein 2 [Colossoma macropomum]